MSNPPKPQTGVLTGAAFLMAVSAIGPGFLTQTTQFAAQLGASLAFAILVSILIDIGAQLNTWRVVCISKKPGHELADAVLPGLGWVLTTVIVLGSFVFNLGNFSGCALGLEVVLGLPPVWGAVASGLIAVVLFAQPKMLTGMDWFSKVLGVAMILMTFYVLVVTRPSLTDAAVQAVLPERIDVDIIVTLVGGTIGGYIMFSGAHRLLDAGVGGPEQAGLVSRASIQGIVITGIMRIVLFLAVLGVVAGGDVLDPDRPVFDAFRRGAGTVGYFLSGLIFWAAAITSVVGCSYTAVSFIPGKRDRRTQARLILAFVVLSLLVTVALNLAQVSSTRLLILAGTINGVLLPVVLGVVLLAAYRRPLMGDYRHPWWVGAIGVAAWVASVVFAYLTVARAVGG